MTLAARLRWIWQAIKTAWQAFRALRVVVATVQASPTIKAQGDIMTAISIDQLKSLAAILGGGAAQNIAKAIDGKPDDALVAIEDVVSMVGVFWPPAGMIAEGIEVLRKVLPLIVSGKIKPHNSGEGGIGADPAGSDNIAGI